MGRPPGTTVFVGNISYDTTEDQLKEVFSQVGNVVSFRLMYDHETGRAKGFGFCEYEDKETAMSARRNLNGTQLNGRPLRVDLTDSDKNNPALNGLALNQPSANKGTSSNPAANPPGALHHPPQPNQMQMQQHAALPPALASANPSMAVMSLADIHKTMVHLKKAVVQNPNEMRELLTANPRLAHAILQGQIMLGMVPPFMVPPPLQQQNAKRQPQQIPQQPPQQRQPIQQRQNMPPPRPAMQPPRPPAPQHPNVPPQPPPQPPHPPMQQVPPPGPNGAPPNVMQRRMMPQIPPQQMPPMQQPQQPHANMDEQTAIITKVLSMSQQEIDELPVEHRNYVLELKQILRMQNAGGMPAGVQQMPPGMPPGAQGPPPPVGQGPAPPQQQYR